MTRGFYCGRDVFCRCREVGRRIGQSVLIHPDVPAESIEIVDGFIKDLHGIQCFGGGGYLNFGHKIWGAVSVMMEGVYRVGQSSN